MTAQSQIEAQDVEIDAEVDAGPRTHELERLCVATRTVQPVTRLIRFVVGPDGEAVPDLKGKLPGRGVWVTATREALDDAITRKALARSFKCDVRVPPDLVSRTDRLLERATLDALAMAGKAGLVVAGFAKAEKALANEDIVAVLHAAEASSEAIRKLDAAIRRRSLNGRLAVIQILKSAQLDLALGRPNVIHAALLAGPPSDTFLTRCQRFERFRAGDRAHQTGAADLH